MLSFLLILAALGSCNKPLTKSESLVFLFSPYFNEAQNLIQLMQETRQTTALELIDLANLTDTLSGEGPFTVFLPSQAAFDALPQDLLDTILADTELLAQVLLYHVVPGTAMSSDLANELLLTTAQGANIRINIYGNIITATGVPIDLANVDIQADNGVVHFLTGVMASIPAGDTLETLPLIGQFGFEGLSHALNLLNLVETLTGLSDITVLAPINSDQWNHHIADVLFEENPQGLETIILDHVAATTLYSAGIGERSEVVTFGGDVLYVVFTEANGYETRDADGHQLADIVAGDIPTTQGVLHIVDRPVIVN